MIMIKKLYPSGCVCFSSGALAGTETTWENLVSLESQSLFLIQKGSASIFIRHGPQNSRETPLSSKDYSDGGVNWAGQSNTPNIVFCLSGYAVGYISPCMFVNPSTTHWNFTQPLKNVLINCLWKETQNFTTWIAPKEGNLWWEDGSGRENFHFL